MFITYPDVSRRLPRWSAFWAPLWGPRVSARRLRALVEPVGPVNTIDTIDPAGPAEVPPHISHAIPRRASRDVARKPRNINVLVSMFERSVGELHARLRWVSARRLRALVEPVAPVDPVAPGDTVGTIDPAGPAEVPPHISHVIPKRVF